LHSTESNVGKPVVDGNDLIVPIESVFVLGGHPLCEENPGPHKGKFIFHDVYSSKCELTEYIGDPKKPDGFKDPYVIENMKSREVEDGDVKEYAFEGIFVDPVAWVDWEIQARSFEFVVEV
jgi:hypothetical protein